MKIRIQGNSIRARLSRSEVARLSTGDSVHQETKFASSSRLVCIVIPTEDVTTATASFDNATIAIALPRKHVTVWANSDQVGLEGEVQIDEKDSLRLLIEKDFECLHSRTDDADDAFPHPLAQQKR